MNAKLEQLGIRLPLFPLTSVGSFTKPDYLKRARTKFARGEMPMEERHRVERVRGDSYLITYKGIYDGMDNTGYFEQFRQSRPELEWHHWQPTYRKGGRWYLVGVKAE